MAQDYPQTVYVPHLSNGPVQAIQEVVSLVESLNGEVAFVGSSLGGFYATWLANKFITRAVLINPAVRPDLLLQDMLEPQSNYHTDGGEYELTANHLEQLASLIFDPLTNCF